jgi:Mce-associated membrane protein
MEGDAGASRLTPNDADDSSSSEVATDQTSIEVKAEDSADSQDDAEHEANELTAQDAAESEDPSGHELTESDAEDLAESADQADDPRGASRLGRRWLVGIAAALVVLAGGVGAGGAWSLFQHRDSRITARHDAAAVEAAKDCVAATQAPDTATMAASAQKIIECGAGAFRSQAILYSGLLVEAYQAANAHVEVSDLRAAVERNNPDGSIEILVPMRVKVTNSETQNQEAGYRLRVNMVSEEGQYRVSKLDQVAR